ncbi:GNAT family N-acetyltransferase [Posidoniimonas corsicana]|nr:GNAT family N-acetyltransferase [Posidoniimonas corsicana]
MNDRGDQPTDPALAFATSIYHHPAWEDACGVYGLKFHALRSELDGAARGFLPLVQQSSPLFGRRLISLPWVDEAGAVGAPDAVASLLDRAVGLAGELGTGYSVIVKQPLTLGGGDLPPGWARQGGAKVLMRLRLESNADALWGRLSPKVRNQVRKAERSGLVTERGGAELLEDFYSVYSQNMRDLGSPSHCLRFFQTLVAGLGSCAEVYCIRLQSRAVGAGIVLHNGRSLDIPWASSLREFNPLCVNHGMYWAVLKDSCDAGHEWFHFGRSSVGSGQHRFKKQWGAEEASLAWWGHSLKQAEDQDPGAAGEKFGLAQRVWTRLPLWASRRIGPLIVRHAP